MLSYSDSSRCEVIDPGKVLGKGRSWPDGVKLVFFLLVYLFSPDCAAGEDDILHWMEIHSLASILPVAVTRLDYE